MNYFELHIGDLTEATAHLSLLEDGVYGRLLRKYYATEKPLPAEVKQIQRLVGARTKEERDAVDTVLAEFFELQDDGWHQSRCDAEIAAFHEKQLGKKEKQETAKERQRRARERRATLFEKLRELGQVPAWTTTTAELETMLSRVTGAQPSQPVTPPVTRDDTASHTPYSKHQSPNSRLQKSKVGGDDAAAQPAPPPPSEPRKRKPKTPEVTLAQWLADIHAKGERAIQTGDSVFTYAESIGLPREFLHLAWVEFKARYTAEPVKGEKPKTYADWRAVFRKAVREGWLKLWHLDGQHFVLSTAGQQAQRAFQAQQQRDEVPA